MIMYLLISRIETIVAKDYDTILFVSGLFTFVSIIAFLPLYVFCCLSLSGYIVCVTASSLLFCYLSFKGVPTIERSAIPLTQDKYLMRIPHLNSYAVIQDKQIIQLFDPDVYAIVTFKELIKYKFKKKNLVAVSQLFNLHGGFFLIFSDDLEEKMKQ